MRALWILAAMSSTAIAGAPTKPTVTDARCTAPPAVKAAGFRHKRSKLIAKAGSSNHRGIDVIASEDDTTQRITGKLAHGKVDKDLDDEDVELFACQDNSTWKSLGVARTDDDGRFALVLGDNRLSTGMRDLYVASLGDGSGAYFIAYVAKRGTGIVVTDVDGTISWSENSIIKQVASRDHDIKHRPGAPEALAKLPYPIVYVTARGDVWIDITRKWLERHGFPRGLLRLSTGAFARPGSKAIEYKTSILRALPVAIAAGIGNRKSDITAYTAIGLAPNQIFIHLPEYAKEVKADLAATKATGFTDYATLPGLVP
jgi:phosphatidate phosphatase PAH1